MTPCGARFTPYIAERLFLVMECEMRPVKRHGVSKGRSAKQFRRNSQRTKAANMKGPMRGGIRL